MITFVTIYSRESILDKFTFDIYHCQLQLCFRKFCISTGKYELVEIFFVLYKFITMLVSLRKTRNYMFLYENGVFIYKICLVPQNQYHFQ